MKKEKDNNGDEKEEEKMEQMIPIYKAKLKLLSLSAKVPVENGRFKCEEILK